jgi:glycosyltransferase involved in cell wall biosynthesis
VEHERSGLLFPSGDAEALADRITTLLDDRPLAERLGRQALADYRQKFMPGHVARTTLDFYESVLDRARFRTRRRFPTSAGATP